MPDLTPDTAAPHPDDGDAGKAALRRRMRALRRTISPPEARHAGVRVADQVGDLPRWPEAATVAVYLAADGEIDTTAVVDRCRTENKQICLPVVLPDGRLAFASWEPGAALVRNRFGIPEPPPEAGRYPLSRLDVMLLPLVAWDRTGTRLGMGGGFYDRTLAAGGSQPCLAGLAYESQEIDALPRQSWDIRMDFVVTEAGLHGCAPGGVAD